jgi:RNA-directed DNA polymerase
MQADTTIRAVEAIAKASSNGKKINGLFRLLGNPEVLWKQAYANLYANKGAVTKGVNNNTLDGFSEERVKHLIRMLNAKEYRFTPARRTYIPKKNGKMRPLGLPTGDDKLVQEVVRILLEQIYEPCFSKHSHGFRPQRSCHTALKHVKHNWTGVRWIIEFDIKSFFDNINHQKLVEMLEKKINDKRIITLVKMMLKAGYIEGWKWSPTYSGTPQGGVISPLLANIYLHELDMFMENMMTSFNRGDKRVENPAYGSLYKDVGLIRSKIQRTKEGKKTYGPAITLSELYQREEQVCAEMRRIPSKDPFDAGYRRMQYIRYADDFIVGVIGSKQDAVELLQKVRDFVQSELHLELSEEKTRIRHAESGVLFLGYEIRSYWSQDKLKKVTVNGKKALKRTLRGNMQLHVPTTRLAQFCSEHGYGDYTEKGVFGLSRPVLLQRSDAEIIMTYNAEMRGITNYYALAIGYKRALNKLIGKARFSCFATMAHKHGTKTPHIMRKLRLPTGNGYGLTVTVKGTPRTYKLFRLADHTPPHITNTQLDMKPNTTWLTVTRSELVQRLNTNACEYCGKNGGYMEVHHIKKLKDVEKGSSFWKRQMSKMYRKTLVLCFDCHTELHGSGLPDWRAKAKAT